ncbi:psuK [Symbiodinium sp. CCMP2456]|nr:psuK [Symbiodinium sp. CCMP2456]
MAPPAKSSQGPGLLVCGGAVMDHVVRPFDSKQHGASLTSMPGEARVSPGGVGRNIAEVAARLGSSVALLGAVGDDAAGRALLHGCGERGIDVQALEVLRDSRTATYTALLDGKGELVGAVAASGCPDSPPPKKHRQRFQGPRASLGQALCNGGLGLVALRLLCVVPLWSHSRPWQTSSARRQRMLKRPSYDRPTGKTAQVNFLNCPTDGGHVSVRSDKAGPMRHAIKRCRTPKQLMTRIDEAVSNNLLEPSIFGAAMQTCGFKGWWRELLALLKLRQQQGVSVDPIEVSIGLTALTSCLKKRGAYGVLQSRASLAFDLARGLCNRLEIDVIADAEILNCFTSSVLKLATCLRSEAARAWALELWDRARALSFSFSGITYSTYIQFLEQYGLCEEVDALLEDAAMSQALNYIVLSGLLEQVSYRKDRERAEVLWAYFLRKGIEPNLICVLARAKVHLLAGRPTVVLGILESGMARCGSCFEENGRLVQEYAQSFLIASHSSLDPQVLHHLREFLESGHFSIEEKTSASMRNSLKQMKSLAEMLLSDPSNLRLHDLLVEWKAREMSVMAKWDNFRAGTRYLDD